MTQEEILSVLNRVRQNVNASSFNSNTVTSQPAVNQEYNQGYNPIPESASNVNEEESVENTESLEANSIDTSDYESEADDSTEEEVNDRSEEENNRDILERIIRSNEHSLETDNTTRFSGAKWFDNISKMSISIFGLGGIGSNAAYIISRCNPSQLTLVDNDNVSSVNLAGQFYQLQHCEIRKVNALIEEIHNFGYTNSILDGYTRLNSSSVKSYLSEVTICGFDNMVARKECFSGVISDTKYGSGRCKLFIDARLAAEKFEVFCIPTDNQLAINTYNQKYLFDDSEAVETVCSYKQTTFCATMLGSVIANLVVNYANNKTNAFQRPLPFYIEYNAALMHLTKEVL